MAVSTVSQREIVEVPYQLPDGSIKPHMALVLSTERLLNAEDGMFYAVLISSKNINPEFTMEIKNEWLNKPLSINYISHISFRIAWRFGFFRIFNFTTKYWEAIS